MHVVFVSQTSLTEHDIDRFSFARLKELGCKVTFIDASWLIFPSKSQSGAVTANGIDLVACRRWREWAVAAPLMASADLIVCHVGAGYWDAENARILGDMCRAGAPYLMSFCNAIPSWGFGSLADPWTRFKARLSHFDPIKSIVSRVPAAWLGIRPADYAVYGGRASQVRPPMVGAQTKPIFAHAYDYDHYLLHADRPRQIENIAVFIDQHLGLHPDVAAMGLRQPFDPDEYYPHLQTYFDRVERATGLEVVIAGHPRSRYPGPPDLFGTRKVFYGITGDLVRRSRLAFTSFSTAINIAVIHEVPVVFVGPKPLVDHPYYGLLMKQMAEILGRPIVSITDDYEIDSVALFSVDGDKYRRYREEYIKQPGSEERPLWDIVLGAVRN